MVLILHYIFMIVYTKYILYVCEYNQKFKIANFSANPCLFKNYNSNINCKYKICIQTVIEFIRHIENLRYFYRLHTTVVLKRESGTGSNRTSPHANDDDHHHYHSKLRRSALCFWENFISVHL